MARIMTVPAEEAKGLRGLIVRMVKRQYGGVVPGIFDILMPDLQVNLPTGWLYNHLPPGSPDVEKLLKTAARYGIEFPPPPAH